MTIKLDRPCMCRGLNPKCARCGGFGYLQADEPVQAKGVALPSAFDEALRASLGEREHGEKMAKAKVVLQRKLEEIAVQKQKDLELERETMRQDIEKGIAYTRVKLQGLYRCLECNYRLNRDPTLKCAMCGSAGPYVSRLDEYERLLAQKSS